MHIDRIKILGTWRHVADVARNTINMEGGKGEPSSKWKLKILMAEHSPIRAMQIGWRWVNLKSWISVHFVRHKIGIEHYVSTQRSDRTGINRDNLPQSALVNHQCVANFQEIISMSRKRLCQQASNETREAWKALLLNIKPLEPELYKLCVPECVYRGFCSEYKSCNMDTTKGFQRQLINYRMSIL